MRRGKLQGRWDTAFNGLDLWKGLLTKLPLLTVRELISASFSGGTPSTSEPNYWTGDIPWVSPKDFGEFEIADAADHLSEAGLKAASLDLASPDSVLVVVRSGILRHTLPVAVNTLPVAVNQDIKVFTLHPGCDPRYFAWYLWCFQDRILPLITKHSTTVQSVNTSEFVNLRIPLPSITQQQELITAMGAARAARRAKLAEADTLLAGLDDYVLAKLGLTPPHKDERKVFAVMCRVALPRFDPHFHLPAFAQILRLLTANGGESLGCVVNFSDEVWKPEKHESATFRYIEISNVDTDTGEARAAETPVAEAPSRARMALHTNDIIVSLTRPHHGAIAQITQELDGCIASTGFAVIRSIDESRITRDYLWCILRTKISLSQMLQRASGGNYPAITESELAKILIPIPDKAVQKVITTEARRRHEKARRLRAEAEAGWQAAKRWFEEQLLGSAQV